MNGAQTQATDAQAIQRLTQYLKWAGSPNLPFAIALVVLWAIVDVPLVGFMAVGVAINAGCAMYAGRLAGEGRIATAVHLYSAGVWAVASMLVLGGEALFPIIAALAILPVVLSLPYVPERVVVRMTVIATAIVVAGAVTMYFDWTFQLDEVARDTLDLIVGSGVIVLAAVLALSVWHTRFTLAEARLQLESTNAALRESERVLEDRVGRRQASLQDANRELAAARDEALAANRHKSEFLANMSHELRTPLNAIVGFSEVLTEEIFGPLEPKQLEYAHDIHDSGRQLLALINNILDIAKIEAGRWELTVSEIDLRDSVDNAVDAHRARAAEAGVTIERVREAETVAVVADELALRRVIDALIDNAVKFTPDGGSVEITIEQHGDDAVVHIVDSGIGLSDADIEVIFDEFRQAAAHYTHRREGTGLGLALARRLVELHGGRVQAESEPGVGSTFSITVPSGGPDGG